MKRSEIVEVIGKDFQTENIENGEFSYVQALGHSVEEKHFKLDLRFYNEKSKVAVLVETKQLYKTKDFNQLFTYVKLEQQLSRKTKIIAILANIKNDMFKIWKIDGDDQIELQDTKLKTYQEYADYFKIQNVNDKTAVLENTSKLNRILHDNGIPEKLRSQFVGTCLLALKNDLTYQGLDTEQIIAGIKKKLGSLLQESMDKAKKLTVLQTKVLENQNVEAIASENFEHILDYIKSNILPYINESSFEGQDILSYFFTTFNKYVAREDKNQAFTPNHICHFMSKVAGIDKSTRVLDPTCGSGTFLVQAMTMELAQCQTNFERHKVKAEQIFGIEFDESVFGLSTTNMLIHGDGNSNIRCGSCFENDKWIENAKIDVVLMNPPYNASKSQMPKAFASKFGNSATDPSKGLYFVNHILECVRAQKGKLLALLPMSCAITNKGVIQELKRKILEHNTLDAVFSFPDEMFYPGASAVACCMVFNVGKPHPTDFETFFGYFKNDGFEKRKGVGRVDIRNKWNSVEKEWLNLYSHRSTIPGKSVCAHVSDKDEWCAEAYMETDYDLLQDLDFKICIRDYAAFKMCHSDFDSVINFSSTPLEKKELPLNVKSWMDFEIERLLPISYKGRAYNAQDLTEHNNVDPSICYVTRTDSNNGCKGFVINEKFEHTEDGNAITVGDTTATIYYQEQEFICGDHMVILRSPKLNKYNGLFLTTIINLERPRYNYGRAFKKDTIAATKIKLPAINTGENDESGKPIYEPDWQFMEDYIKSLPYSACL